MKLRTLAPDDYEPIVSVVDSWWGRPIAGSLPRLFFDHFHTTSFVASSESLLHAREIRVVQKDRHAVGGVPKIELQAVTARELERREHCPEGVLGRAAPVAAGVGVTDVEVRDAVGVDRVAAGEGGHHAERQRQTAQAVAEPALAHGAHRAASRNASA